MKQDSRMNGQAVDARLSSVSAQLHADAYNIGKEAAAKGGSREALRIAFAGGPYVEDVLCGFDAYHEEQRANAEQST